MNDTNIEVSQVEIDDTEIANQAPSHVVVEELRNIKETVRETGVSENTIRNYIKSNKIYYEKVEAQTGPEYRISPSEVRAVYEGRGVKHRGGLVPTDQAAMLEAIFTQQSSRLEEALTNQTAMLATRIEESANQPDPRIEALLNKVDSLQKQLANMEASQVRKGFKWPWLR